MKLLRRHLLTYYGFLHPTVDRRGMIAEIVGSQELQEGLLGPHVLHGQSLGPLAVEVLSLDGVVAEVDGLVKAAQSVLLRGEPEDTVLEYQLNYVFGISTMFFNLKI